jgi:hypothetical protein
MKIEDMNKARPGDHCLICGAHPNVIGVFVPEDPIQWGAPTGKTRLIRYCLCKKCKGRPQTPEQVEKILKSELVGGVAHA